MHGQGNYRNQPAPAFQQCPPPPPPPPSHHGPQVNQQGHPSFHPTPGILAYHQHVPNQGPPALGVSSGMASAQSYPSHLQPPQVSYPHPPSEWNQNASSQGHTLERGLHHQSSFHAPPPTLPYSSTSSFLMSDSFGSTVPSMRQHSYVHPPPPPPLLPPSSPPPLPPSSPPSDVLSSLKGSLDGENLMLEHAPPEKSKHQNEVPSHQPKNNEPTMGSMDVVVVVANSPADSDMDMEDDITHPDEEKKNCVSSNSSDAFTSIPQEHRVRDQVQALHCIGENRIPKADLHGNFLFSEASALEDQRGGSAVAPDCDSPITKKVSSEAYESGMAGNGRTEWPWDGSVNEYTSKHKYSSQPSVPVVCAEIDSWKLPGQLMEGTNSFKLLQGYASDNTSENAGENLLEDVSTPALNGQKACDFGSKRRPENLSESNKHMPPISMIKSPRNVIEADKLSFATGIVEDFSGKSHKGQESATISAVLQSKDPLRKNDANIDLEGANVHEQDIKSFPTKLNVDEFGRLVREGVTDSDTSDSPHYARRHARRARKRRSGQSRSRSPHDRRGRKERRGRSRSSPPERRRSRSTSPVLKRNSDFSGDKWRREKSQRPECFDFLRGKCYRGATCRYSHQETDKSERLRYNRGKQHYQETPPTSRSRDVREEGKVLFDKEVTDKGRGLFRDVPRLNEVRDTEELPIDSTILSCDKVNNLVSGSLPAATVVASSGYLAHDLPSGQESCLIPEYPAQYTDKTPQILDQQCKRVGDSYISESSSHVQTSAHIPADSKQGPTSQLHAVKSPIIKPYSTEEVQSQSLKELPPSVVNHPSHLTLPLPVSQVMSQATMLDYNLRPPVAQFQLNPENHSYQAPAAYQHSHFPGSSSPFLPPPPPDHLSVNVTPGEHSNPSQHTQQSLQPGISSYNSMRAQPAELPNGSQTGQYQVNPQAWEPDPMQLISNNFRSGSLHVSNLMSLQNGPPHIIGERVTGQPVQGLNLPSFAQAQPYSVLMKSPSKATHSYLGGGLPSDINSSHGHPCFQQGSYSVKFSAATQIDEPGSSMTSVIPGNHPSYVQNFLGPKISNHFNPYASTFDLPLSSKFHLNATNQENDTTIITRYGAPIGSSSVSVDAYIVGSVVSNNMIFSLSSGFPAESVLPGSGGDQYDPLFDSIEPASASFSRADHRKHETPGDSDNMPGLGGSGRVLNAESIKQEWGTNLSANDSIENEEFGETAEAEVGAVLNGSLSTPNDATGMNAGEIEIDQVKVSRKKRKHKDSRSMKLFKVSVATFVKEVLKPSWRQGNMSKEAFKTIVKKTVDKVSGAMKSNHIPKSHAKIDHYIDSSRGKLTKLVMGYVEKYVKA